MHAVSNTLLDRLVVLWMAIDLNAHLHLSNSMFFDSPETETRMRPIWNNLATAKIFTKQANNCKLQFVILNLRVGSMMDCGFLILGLDFQTETAPAFLCIRPYRSHTPHEIDMNACIPLRKVRVAGAVCLLTFRPSTGPGHDSWPLRYWHPNA